MNRFYRLYISTAFLAVITLASCGGPRVVEIPLPVEKPPPVPKVVTPLERPPIVRVLVLDAGTRVRVRIHSAFFIAESWDAAPLRKFEKGGDFVIRSSGESVELVEQHRIVFEAQIVMLKPASKEKIYINGKPYRGAFLFRVADGRVVSINVIEVDDYIKGVLPSEIGYLKPGQFEAYRAQAIVSRSYALSKLEEKRMEMYDLKATLMDQVYAGVHGETPEASRAVEETRGMVGIWNGEPIRAYYSSCCGGHTADIRTSWPWKTPYPYLEGIRDCETGKGEKSFCRGSPHFRWRMQWDGKTLERILQKTLPQELGIKPGAVGKLLDIKVLDTARDGRVAQIEIDTSRGSYKVTGDRIRWVMRPDLNSDAILKSTLFKMHVKRSGGRVSKVELAPGGGNGHGIGMCQAGAIRMAELGYSAEEIIEHYYPGVVIYPYYK
jgi:stage II sporulation protein D